MSIYKLLRRAPARVCGTCRHWAGECPDQQAFAWCMSEIVNGSRGGVLVDPLNESKLLRTWPSFGCNHWEADDESTR